LKRWLSKELGITEKYLVLMTPRGSQVKPQYWADEVCLFRSADESEVFVFDRELLSRRSPAPVVSFTVPTVSTPPENGITSKASLKAHLSHLRSRAAWARTVANQTAEIQKRIDSTNEEIVVLQKSAKIALVNLGNVSRSLQRAFTDTEMLADKKLQARKQLLVRIPSGVAVLNTIKVHPVFGKEEETLGEFFDDYGIRNAVEVCGKAHGEVENRITELKQTMEEFIQQGEGLKKEMLGWQVKSIPDGGHVREITLIADKIERGIL
jgi:Autophagy protein ATG17-like domain